MKKIYAGIGSRKTPEEIQSVMGNIARNLAKAGWTLRSGAANGADAAFEAGCDSGNGKKEIYLPWRYFNTSRSPLFTPSDLAHELAAALHPNWKACSEQARLLHARNMHQILGKNLDSPVDMVICWTPNASRSGGTGQALRLATKLNIPVFDLADTSQWNLLQEFVGTP